MLSHLTLSHLTLSHRTLSYLNVHYLNLTNLISCYLISSHPYVIVRYVAFSYLTGSYRTLGYIICVLFMCYSCVIHVYFTFSPAGEGQETMPSSMTKVRLHLCIWYTRFLYCVALPHCLKKKYRRLHLNVGMLTSALVTGYIIL